MGRHAGFIASGSTIASQDVNFTLVPEIPFKLDGPLGFLAALKQRVLKRKHAVIVVAEGAGQDLLKNAGDEYDASGNIKLKDIGLFLKEQIAAYFKAENIPATLRYFDPNYIIRSVRADSEDAILCDFYARNAVHAAMSGRTGLLVGLHHDVFIHVPVELLATRKKRIDPKSQLWHAVLSSTGQPASPHSWSRDFHCINCHQYARNRTACQDLKTRSERASLALLHPKCDGDDLCRG